MLAFQTIPARYAASLWEMGERPFARSLYMGEAWERPLKVNYRSPSLCLVAAHAVSHHREGRIKPADVYTGGLVRLLGMVTGATSLVAQTCVISLEPRAGEISPVEQRILALYQQQTALHRPFHVLDFHGARDTAAFDVALGTGPDEILPAQQKLIESLTVALSAKGLRVALNPEGYQAKTAQALTRRLRAQGLGSVLQIEIVRRCRQPGSLQGLRLCRALERVAHEFLG